MDRTTRCLHCGKRLVPVPKGGRTALECIRCNGAADKDKWKGDAGAVAQDQ
jgi:phage FluMu protein Com